VEYFDKRTDYENYHGNNVTYKHDLSSFLSE